MLSCCGKDPRELGKGALLAAAPLSVSNYIRTSGTPTGVLGSGSWPSPTTPIFNENRMNRQILLRFNLCFGITGDWPDFRNVFADLMAFLFYTQTTCLRPVIMSNLLRSIYHNFLQPYTLIVVFTISQIIQYFYIPQGPNSAMSPD